MNEKINIGEFFKGVIEHNSTVTLITIVIVAVLWFGGNLLIQNGYYKRIGKSEREDNTLLGPIKGYNKNEWLKTGALLVIIFSVFIAGMVLGK